MTSPKQEPPTQRGPRGPKKFHYTYRVLAEVFGLQPETVINYAAQNRFDPDDLKSVIEFFIKRREQGLTD